MEFDEKTGKMFNVKPHPLFVIRSRANEDNGEDADAAGEESKLEEGSQADAEGSKNLEKPKDAADGQKKPDASMQSGMTSSLADTSEDETARAEAEAAKAKANKKGLTAKELEAGVDIELRETET